MPRQRSPGKWPSVGTKFNQRVIGGAAFAVPLFVMVSAVALAVALDLGRNGGIDFATGRATVLGEGRGTHVPAADSRLAAPLQRSQSPRVGPLTHGRRS